MKSNVVVFALMTVQEDPELVQPAPCATVKVGQDEVVWVRMCKQHSKDREELRAEMHRIVDSAIDVGFPVV